MRTRIVSANGCFDPLHPGHFFMLGYCRAQGDILIVGVNSDRYIRAHKRPDPIPQDERVNALYRTGIPTDVEVFYEDNPCEFIRWVRPDVHCIGEEYRGKAPEESVCAEMGISVVYVPRVGPWSSAAIRLGSK